MDILITEADRKAIDESDIIMTFLNKSEFLKPVPGPEDATAFGSAALGLTGTTFPFAYLPRSTDKST